MKYLTSLEVAKKWNISQCRIILLARQGRIKGAVKIGRNWVFEEDAQKPIDNRTKISKKDNETENFRYPEFAFQDVNSFFPPLSQEDLQLKKVEEEFLACNYENANDILSNLPETATNRYCRIYALYLSCMISINICDINKFFDKYAKLSLELQKDFPYKKEMSYLVYEIETSLGYPQYFTNEFKLDTNYNYHPSFTVHLTSLCAISLYTNIEKTNLYELNFFEISCKLLDSTNNYNTQLLYCFLSSTFAIAKEYDKMIFYFKKALQIAQKYTCYYSVASQYYYMKELLNPAFNDFSNEFKQKIEFLADDLQNRFIDFTKKLSLNSIYKALSHYDYMLILYAVQGYKSKELVDMLKISQSYILKRYEKIYKITGVKNKAELVKLYNDTVNSPVLNK